MSGGIKKIDYIKNLAVFRDFDWNSSVRDKGNNIAEFKKINILYGRNYSGKTTLSRIIRALKTGSLSDKYNSPEFKVSFDGIAATQNSLNNHGHQIRVFNEDFVKDNLLFIVDDEQSINSFAILGEDNTKIEEEIEKHESELGREEAGSGLVGIFIDSKKKLVDAKEAYLKKSTELEERLRNKANKAGTGIKHNKSFGNANYNLPKLEKDIVVVTNNSYVPLSDAEVKKHYDLLKEIPKNKLSETEQFDLKFSTIVSKAKELIEKKIQKSGAIPELASDAALEMWVRTGRERHQGKREKCAFCGGKLDSKLWDKLDRHFNQESEELRNALENLLRSIEREHSRIPPLLKINNSDFYLNFNDDLNSLAEQFAALSVSYCKSLDSIKEQVEKRKDDIFTPFRFDVPNSDEMALNTVRDSFEQLRSKSNELTASLGNDQLKARAALRLHEVYTFINDIQYADERAAIDTLKETMSNAEGAQTTAKEAVNKKQEKILELKAKLKDESKGADQVNEYLNNFFGHQYLSLKAIEYPHEGASSGYRFEVTRNNKKAFHLSEGECSLIAFCYFMAKLEDIETKGNQPIIWIDDPISSLDANHIFFVYSLINAEIVTPEKYEDGGEIKERDRFKQLFISTHNLDFLKYLKRLPGALNKKQSSYFIISRVDKYSEILLMPTYLKDYVTEFNFLFHQIYKCASIENVTDYNYMTFYNFGNNSRKFFEIYLYYKYPDQGMTRETLESFFGEESVPAVLTDRINNEYSHLAGVFERGATPVEVPEMQIAAKSIIETMKKKEPDQYSSLLRSVGVTEEPVEEMQAVEVA